MSEVSSSPRAWAAGILEIVGEIEREDVDRKYACPFGAQGGKRLLVRVVPVAVRIMKASTPHCSRTTAGRSSSGAASCGARWRCRDTALGGGIDAVGIVGARRTLKLAERSSASRSTM